MKKFAIAAMASTALTAFGFAPARADVVEPAWTITGTPTPTLSATNVDIGEAFSTNGSIDVSALGYYYDGSHWAGPVTVTLYDSSGLQISSATLNASLIGTNDYTVGQFIYTNISDVIINGNYEIDAAGGSTGEYYTSSGASYSVDPNITYTGEASQTDPLADPQVGGYASANTTGIFGGDFQGVPEPATMTLLGAGLVGLGLIRRRRRA